MAVFIDINMPKNCRSCPFLYNGTSYWCYITGESMGEEEIKNERNEYCPLIEAKIDWHYIDKHDLPIQDGRYFCSVYDIKKNHKYTRYVLFSKTNQKFFIIKGHEVYAWTETIQPASK